MHYKKVEICGVNSSQLVVLKETEKRKLLKMMHEGNTKEKKFARDQLVKGNLRLVLSVIQKFSNRGVSLDDLFQIGCIGLIKAIDNFDMNINVKFSTYGVPMIIGEIKRYLRDNNSIRVSRALKDIAYKTVKVKEDLTKEKNREPTISEISDKLGISKEKIVLALESISEPISIFEPLFTSDTQDSLTIMDQVNGGSDYNDWTDEIYLKDSLKELKPREKKILTLRFLYGKTQREVAAILGVSQAQVSRLEKKVINRIKGQSSS